MANTAIIYLYKEGNECTNITGGWKEGIYRGAAENFCNDILRLDKNEDHLYLYSKNEGGSYDANVSASPESLNLTNVNVTKLNWVYSFSSNNNAPSGWTSFQANGSEVYKRYDSNGTATKASFTTNINGSLTSVKIAVSSEKRYRRYTTTSLHNLYVETANEIITLDSQNQKTLFINLNSLGNILTFSNVSLIWNDKVIQTYENISITDEATPFVFDDSEMFYGENNITIQATYNQGNGLPDGTVDLAIVYSKDVVLYEIEEPIADLVANTSPREFLDRIYMINNIVDEFMVNLQDLLAYRGHVVDENLRLSELILAISDLIHDGGVEDIVRQKLITVLRNKGVSVTGNETMSELIDIVNTKL